MKKKVLAVLLGVVMGLSLVGCGGSGQNAQEGGNDAAAESDAGEAEEAAAEPDAGEAGEAEEPDAAAGADASEEDAAEAEGTEEAGNDGASGLPAGSKIGFSTLLLSSEFFAALDEDTHKYLEADGYEVVTVSCEGNAATQVSDIENLISMDCDAILLFPADPSAVQDVCAKAVESGIKVFPLATSFENRDAYTYIMGTDQYASGVNCAKMTAAWIDATFPDAEDGSIEVAIIGNTQSAEASDRTDGFYTIEEETSKAKVVEMFDLTGATDTNIKTQEYADVIVSKYPNVKAVMAYGVDAELGANEVFMRDSNLDREHFGIFGVDTSQVGYEQIKLSATNDSLIRGTVNLGDDLAMDIYELITGQLDDLVDADGYIFKPSTIIDISNVDDYLE